MFTPQLPIHPDVRIVIELNDPGRNYKVGESIDGVVKVLADKQFDASSISLRIYGCDSISYAPQGSKVSFYDQKKLKS